MMTGGTPMTQETSIYCGMFMGFSGNIMEYQRISKSPKATPQYQNISQHCFPPKRSRRLLRCDTCTNFGGEKKTNPVLDHHVGNVFMATPAGSTLFSNASTSFLVVHNDHLLWLNHSKSPKGQQGFWYWGEQLLSTLRPRRLT